MRHIWVRTSYETHARDLVHALKFGRKQAAVTPLARLMAEVLPYFPAETIVTHVPTASVRIRQRGYDHAALLARALAHELGLTYAPLLMRVGQARQVGAKRSERLRQLNDAFRPVKEMPRAPILLVDDLVTTGGTLEAAGRALRRANAKVIDAVVFAQKE